MEFHSKLLGPMGERRGRSGPLPFYMTYPGYKDLDRETMSLRDLEYLEQMYPEDIRRYRRRIAEILDRSDYEGSMIYDEYPDKYSLRALTGSMQKILEREEGRKIAEEIIQILLFHEIYKRRHGGRRGTIYF